MTISRIIAAGLMAASLAHPVRAGEVEPDKLLPAKQAGTFIGSSLAGAALGGPLGLAAGAMLGAWYGERLADADALENTEQQLASAHDALSESREQQLVLKEELRIARDTNEQYARLVLDQLELEMMFRTDASQLTDTGDRRLRALAAFLVQNPQISIRLDGYADPRGAAAYNADLSLQRVSHVARVLQEEGVPLSRIATYSHGASQSTASAGDYDAYALERVVKINLQQDVTGIAQAH